MHCTDDPDDKENDMRFQFLMEDECNKLREGYTLANTAKSTKWALNNSAARKDARAKALQEKCPDDPVLIPHSPHCIGMPATILQKVPPIALSVQQSCSQYNNCRPFI